MLSYSFRNSILCCRPASRDGTADHGTTLQSPPQIQRNVRKGTERCRQVRVRQESLWYRSPVSFNGAGHGRVSDAQRCVQRVSHGNCEVFPLMLQSQQALFPDHTTHCIFQTKPHSQRTCSIGTNEMVRYEIYLDCDFAMLLASFSYSPCFPPFQLFS